MDEKAAAPGETQDQQMNDDDQGENVLQYLNWQANLRLDKMRQVLADVLHPRIKYTVSRPGDCFYYVEVVRTNLSLENGKFNVTRIQKRKRALEMSNGTVDSPEVLRRTASAVRALLEQAGGSLPSDFVAWVTEVDGPNERIYRLRMESTTSLVRALTFYLTRW